MEKKIPLYQILLCSQPKIKSLENHSNNPQHPFKLKCLNWLSRYSETRFPAEKSKVSTETPSSGSTILSAWIRTDGLIEITMIQAGLPTAHKLTLRSSPPVTRTRPDFPPKDTQLTLAVWAANSSAKRQIFSLWYNLFNFHQKTLALWREKHANDIERSRTRTEGRIGDLRSFQALFPVPAILLWPTSEMWDNFKILPTRDNQLSHHPSNHREISNTTRQSLLKSTVSPLFSILLDNWHVIENDLFFFLNQQLEP